MLKTKDLKNGKNFELLDWSGFLSEKEREDLGREVCEAYTVDKDSMDEWSSQNEEWVKLATQVLEETNFPWPRAASIKYPLLTSAALQFHARAHQELLKDEKLVKAKVIGEDPTGEKSARAARVEKAMSYQRLYEDETWQDEADRMLMVLPIIGTVFKKSYWDPIDGTPKSDLLLPGEMTVNYFAKDWKKARRSHCYEMSRNDILTMQHFGYFREDIKLDLSRVDADGEAENQLKELELAEEDRAPSWMAGDVPFNIIEQHYEWDLDGDGYKEPYIIWVCEETEEVFRITPRYRPQDIVWNELDNRKVKRFKAIEFCSYVKFLPRIDSNIFGAGFGQLLGPLNKATNAIINQLINAGTMATMQSGFLGRGIRISKGGSMSLRPNEWRQVQNTGDDLKKAIFPLPTPEPSTVLFQLLGFLVQSGKEVGSVTEVMTGKNPGQNQPLGTTQTVLEQGLQVFSGIYKRTYRGMKMEYQILYMLNSMYLDEGHYQEILDDQEASVRDDFEDKTIAIVPEADENISRKLKAGQRAQQLVEALRAGMPLNKQYVTRLFLESIDEPHVDVAMQMEPPPPSEHELRHKIEEGKLKLEQQKLEWEKQRDMYQAAKDMAETAKALAEATGEGGQAEQIKAASVQFKAIADMIATQQKTQAQLTMDQSKMQLEQVKGQTEQVKASAQAQSAQAQAQAAQQQAQYAQQNTNVGPSQGGGGQPSGANSQG